MVSRRCGWAIGLPSCHEPRRLESRAIVNGLCVLACAAVLAACQQKEVRIVASPYASGQEHTEPVVYNGKRYEVSFRFIATEDAYRILVGGKGRALGGEPGDREIVEAVATSSLRYFACPDGQKGKLVPDTAEHVEGRWTMKVRCA